MENKNYTMLSDKDLQKIDGGIGGHLGNALNGLGTWAKMMNGRGFVNQWEVYANKGKINQYRPY
ncbi:bacteriocin leader domain-containing protein [Lactococcus muris]|uniref:Bacteriocin leader domain-containing protein n=1 Tax=Lactococcus muris TaxID=2941330 RepID=A0ABV4D912_9LACT